MTDEAATGVAYEVHDAPTLDRERERDEDHDTHDTEDRARAAMLRRFARSRATAPVEPMS